MHKIYRSLLISLSPLLPGRGSSSEGIIRGFCIVFAAISLLEQFIFLFPAAVQMYGFIGVAPMCFLFFVEQWRRLPYVELLRFKVTCFQQPVGCFFERVSALHFFGAARLQKEPTGWTTPEKRILRSSVRRNDAEQRTTVWPIIVLGFLVLCVGSVQAQDPVFTQAFLSPVYLNPAATGTGQYDLRVSGIYRRQWWTIPSNINYTAVSVDKFIPEVSGGLGVMATHSSEGYLSRNGIYGSYAYNICGGVPSKAENGGSPKWFWTGGLQFGMAQARVNYNKLVFADQLDTEGYIPGSTSSVVPFLKNGKVFPDFAAGMFYSRNFSDHDRLLAGFSSHHLNSPDESLTYSSDSVRAQLPVLWTGNLLFTHTNENNTWSYSIAGIYYRQANYTSMQAGVEVTQNEYDISLGMWYRGSSNFKNINTFSISLSINLAGGDNGRDKLRAGVCHDAELNKKGYSYTTGSSELGFVWDHNTYNSNADDPCKPKISSLICPGVNR